MKTVILICVLAVLALIGWLLENRRMQHYWSRACAGGRWIGSFPSASKTDIRQFLKLFMDAFGFRRARALRFRPDDRIMDVYRAVHPPQWTLADSMELESFATRCQTRYGIDVFDAWRDDITLGEVFALTQKGNAEPGTGGNR